MTEEFGKSGEPVQQQGFKQDGEDKAPVVRETSITPDELIALQKRDENAQAHIPQLEGENDDLREQNALLAAKLDSATTLDDVVERIKSERSDDGTPVDAASVVEQVEQRLALKARESVEDANWMTVVGTLTEQYGDWKTADAEIQAQCAQLNMNLSEANRLARQSPEAFYKTFSKAGSPAPQQGIASASQNETSNFKNADTDMTELRAHYKKMRRENPAKYNKLETQEQMWKDLYGT
jgi:hypothetical protein